MIRFCVQGLRFDTRYTTFRVKACNKAVAGEFSEPVTLETHGEDYQRDRKGEWVSDSVWLISSIQLQAGLLVVPPEPEGGGHECGVGRLRGEAAGHPQREEQNQLPNALASQVRVVGGIKALQLPPNE